MISPSLTLFALLPTFGLPLVMIVLGGEYHRRSLAVQDQFGDISSFVQEDLSGLRIVRAYAQERAETGLFHALDAGYQQRNMALARIQGLFDPLLMLLAGAGAVVALVLGGQGVLAGRITIGGFVAFGLYLATLVWPMIALGWAISLLQRGDAAFDRVDAMFRVTPRPRRPDTPGAAAAVGRRAPRHVRAGLVPVSRRRSTAAGCCRTSRSTWRPARRWAWSAPPAAASRRSSNCWRGATTRIGAGS